MYVYVCTDSKVSAPLSCCDILVVFGVLFPVQSTIPSALLIYSYPPTQIRNAVRDYLKTMDDRVVFDNFLQVHNRFPQLLYPAFRIQVCGVGDIGYE
jgi:hypothetical protein